MSVLLLSFEVPGAAVPKGRPRVTRTKRGRILTHTLDETTAFEARVRFAYQRALMSAHPGAKCGVKLGSRWVVEPFFGAARLSVTIWFDLPDHRPKDIDNLAKGVLDGLNVAAWRDDSQVDRANPRRHLRRKESDPMSEAPSTNLVLAVDNTAKAAQPTVSIAEDFRLCDGCGRSQTRTRVNGTPLCTACARARHGLAT